jgi:hypothetical protein
MTVFGSTFGACIDPCDISFLLIPFLALARVALS